LIASQPLRVLFWRGIRPVGGLGRPPCPHPAPEKKLRASSSAVPPAGLAWQLQLAPEAATHHASGSVPLRSGCCFALSARPARPACAGCAVRVSQAAHCRPVLGSSPSGLPFMRLRLLAAPAPWGFACPRIRFASHPADRRGRLTCIRLSSGAISPGLASGGQRLAPFAFPPQLRECQTLPCLPPLACPGFRRAACWLWGQPHLPVSTRGKPASNSALPGHLPASFSHKFRCAPVDLS